MDCFCCGQNNAEKKLTLDAASAVVLEESRPLSNGGFSLPKNDLPWLDSTVGNFQIVQCKITARHGEKLGFNVDFSDSALLRVTAVRPGLLSEWNERNPDQYIDVGALISNVNGKGGNSRELLNQITTEPSLEMTVHIPNRCSLGLKNPPSSKVALDRLKRPSIG